MKTFAYATTDTASLMQATTAMAATIQQLAADVTARQVDAAETDALVAARSDALAAFGLTAADPGSSSRGQRRILRPPRGRSRSTPDLSGSAECP